MRRIKTARISRCVGGGEGLPSGPRRRRPSGLPSAWWSHPRDPVGLVHGEHHDRDDFAIRRERAERNAADAPISRQLKGPGTRRAGCSCELLLPRTATRARSGDRLQSYKGHSALANGRRTAARAMGANRWRESHSRSRRWHGDGRRRCAAGGKALSLSSGRRVVAPDFRRAGTRAPEQDGDHVHTPCGKPRHQDAGHQRAEPRTAVKDAPQLLRAARLQVRREQGRR